jgi:hypothetical protein
MSAMTAMTRDDGDPVLPWVFASFYKKRRFP